MLHIKQNKKRTSSTKKAVKKVLSLQKRKKHTKKTKKVKHGIIAIAKRMMATDAPAQKPTSDPQQPTTTATEAKTHAPSWDATSPVEDPLRGYWSNTRMFTGYYQMRKPLLGQHLPLISPTRPLSRQELWEHNNAVQQLLNQTAPDPKMLEKAAASVPLIQAFNQLPDSHRLNDPDYKRFVMWHYVPEYREKVVKMAAADQKNNPIIPKKKPMAYRIGYAVGNALGIMATVNKKMIELGQAFIKMVGTPGATWSATKSIGRSIKNELVHMYHGFKDLGNNVGICVKIVKKKLQGKELVRSERRMLVRTVGDLLRIVPLIVIVAIPFLEFALPVLLKLFPNMLPSTFADKDREKQQQRAEFKARLELAEFLQETVGAMTLKRVDAKQESLNKQMAPEVKKVLEQRVDEQRQREQEQFYDDFKNMQKMQKKSKPTEADLELQKAAANDAPFTKLMKAGLKASKEKRLKKQLEAQLQKAEEEAAAAAEKDADGKKKVVKKKEDDEFGQQQQGFLPAPRPSPLVDLLDDLFARVGEGEDMSQDEVLPLLQVYQDALSLDKMSTEQLIAMAQFMKVPVRGSNEQLRKKLEKKMVDLRADDLAIRNEGVENLGHEDLRDACRERGMRCVGLTKQQLEKEMTSWLKLSIDLRLPPSLLIFSRAISMVGNMRRDRAPAPMPAASKAEAMAAVAAAVSTATTIGSDKQQQQAVTETPKDESTAATKPIIKAPTHDEDAAEEAEAWGMSKLGGAASNDEQVVVAATPKKSLADAVTPLVADEIANDITETLKRATKVQEEEEAQDEAERAAIKQTVPEQEEEESHKQAEPTKKQATSVEEIAQAAENAASGNAPLDDAINQLLNEQDKDIIKRIHKLKSKQRDLEEKLEEIDPSSEEGSEEQQEQRPKKLVISDVETVLVDVALKKSKALKPDDASTESTDSEDVGEHVVKAVKKSVLEEVIAEKIPETAENAAILAAAQAVKQAIEKKKAAETAAASATPKDPLNAVEAEHNKVAEADAKTVEVVKKVQPIDVAAAAVVAAVAENDEKSESRLDTETAKRAILAKLSELASEEEGARVKKAAAAAAKHEAASTAAVAPAAQYLDNNEPTDDGEQANTEEIEEQRKRMIEEEMLEEEEEQELEVINTTNELINKMLDKLHLEMAEDVVEQAKQQPEKKAVLDNIVQKVVLGDDDDLIKAVELVEQEKAKAKLQQAAAAADEQKPETKQ